MLQTYKILLLLKVFVHSGSYVPTSTIVLVMVPMYNPTQYCSLLGYMCV